MTFTVEDGTGLADADAFVSVEDCDTYCTSRGLTGWTSVASSPADDKEAAIRRATAYLSTAFTWKGLKLNGRAQALAFPRTGVVDGDGDDVASDEVPSEIVAACCEVAALEIVTPGFTSPTVTMTERVKRERVDVIETEYATAPFTPDAARPALLFVNDLVAGLLASGSNALVGTAVRG